MKNKIVAVVGASNIDICGKPNQALRAKDSNPGTITMTSGGVGRNIAANLCLLGVKTKFLTALGDDFFSRQIEHDCEASGIDLEAALKVSGGASSVYMYIAEEDGEMAVAVSYMELIREVTPEYLEGQLDILDSADIVVADGNLTTESLLWLSRNCSVPLFADPVSASKALRFQGLLPGIDTFKPNLMEALALTDTEDADAALDELLDMGVKRVFLSMGAEGVVAADSNTRLRIPALPSTLVDNTGAGDAVMAALTRARLDGLDLAQSAKFAMAVGAISVEGVGAVNAGLSYEAALARMRLE